MALSVGPITQVVVGPTTASLSCAAATGGTGPYTYQWYRSTSAFVPSSATILSGQTGLTLLDTPLTADTIYYYALVATDTTSATATTAAFGLVTAQQGQTAYLNPAVADFQNFFQRDFPFGTDINNNVVLQDILTAFWEANGVINVNLFEWQSTYTQGYYYLSAHMLTENLRMSSQGINGQFAWLQTSKGVGPVSEGFSIPDVVLRNPVFAAWSKTNYGRKYLTMILPMLTGPMTSVFGNTKP
jgi:hypothetical protein